MFFWQTSNLIDSYMKRAFAYNGSSLWNDLPVSHKQATNVPSLKQEPSSVLKVLTGLYGLSLLNIYYFHYI